jgi:hypothetical protein
MKLRERKKKFMEIKNKEKSKKDNKDKINLFKIWKN